MIIAHLSMQTVAAALCDVSCRDCVYAIQPPWMADSSDDAVSAAWAEVQTLKRQRDELKALWPHKAEELDRQFNETVLQVAERLMDKLTED